MKPVYLDLHIHTSADADNLNAGYDVGTLHDKVQSAAMGSPFLISLTDHNCINKSAYLSAALLFPHLLIGAELHLRNYSTEPPYHCHIFFRSPVAAGVIDALNDVLDSLYPKKMVCSSNKIPTIEELAKHFDAHEFLLLPHGGQSHSTFDMSIPKGVQFDTTVERSIYYNHFDGFTARSNSGLEDTQNYFRRLGIYDFVNLITSCKRRSKTAAPVGPVQNCGTPCRRPEAGQIGQGFGSDGSALEPPEARRCTRTCSNGPRFAAGSCRMA